MNRRQRRRDRSDLRSKQHSKNLIEGIKDLSQNGVMNMTIVPTNQIFDQSLDPEVLAGIVVFTTRVMQGGRPNCLTCDFEWTDLRAPAPAAVCVVRTHDFFRDRSKSATELVSGICRSCWGKDDLLDLCVARYRGIWPELRTDDIHIAPDAVQ
jgi:hypothetical protein